MTPRQAFVGRGPEISLLRDLLAAPEGSATCVMGPAGIGKTRFVEEVVAGLDQRDDLRAVWARCWDGPGTPALWPWVRLLQQLPGGDAEEVLRLRNGVEPEDSRFVQYEAVANRLLKETESARLLLVIDDIHWADPASLQLIKFLARDRRNAHLHLLTTMRSPEASYGPNAELIKDIERESLGVQLSGLTNSEIAELLQDASEDLVRLLTEQTGGNPFFLLETARILRAAGPLNDASYSSLPATPNIRSVINNHLSLVSSDTREMLAVAAVQGRVFDADVTRHAAGATEIELQNNLREATENGLVERLSDGQVQFEHALIGETLLTGLAAKQLAQAHLATVDAIEALLGLAETDLAGPVANHLFAAGILVSSDRLLAAAKTAAQHAASQFAWEDQLHFLSLAEHTLRTDEPDQDRCLINLMVERVVAAKQLRDLDQAQSLGLAAASAARQLNDPVAFAHVALAFPPDVYAVEIDEDFNPDQRRLRTEALDRLEGVNNQSALRSRLQASLALSLYWETPTGDRATSHQHSASRREQLTQQALATARSLGDPATLAFSLNARIYANWGPAIRAERPALAEELIRLGHEMDDLSIAMGGRVWRIAKLFEIGDLAEAEREVRSFEITATEIQNRVHLWTAARWRAAISLLKGDLSQTSSLLDESLVLGSKIMDPESAFLFYSISLSTLSFLRCEFDQLIDYLAQNVLEKPLVPAWRAGLAIAAAETGDLKVARSELEYLCADDFAPLPRDLNFLPTLVVLALVSLHVRDPDLGIAIHHQLLDYDNGWAIYGTGYATAGHVTLALAHTAEAAGQDELARSYYQQAITDIDRTGSPYRGTARVDMANLICHAEPEAAVEFLAEAEAVFVEAELGVRAARAGHKRSEIVQQLAIRLERSTQGWMLSKSGAVPVNLGELKGLQALACLLERPNQDVHALELVALLEGHASPLPRGASVELLDEEARSQYAKRLAELQHLLDRADRDGNAAASDSLAREFDMIAGQLRNASWMGRSRFIRSDADRARVSVTKLIKRSIVHVSRLDPAVGKHLAECVETGMYCAYRPADTRTRWTVKP